MSIVHLLKPEEERRKFIYAIFGATLVIAFVTAWLIYTVSPTAAFVTFAFFFIAMLMASGKKDFANGQVDFIDTESKTIYVVNEGLIKLSHIKIPFESISDLTFTTIPPQGKHAPRFFKIAARVDGKDFLIYRVHIRKRFNQVARNLADGLNLTPVYKTTDTLYNNSGYSFEDTLYNYNSSPNNYRASIWFGAFFCLLGVLAIRSLWFNVPMLAVTLQALTQYRGSKAELARIKSMAMSAQTQ